MECYFPPESPPWIVPLFRKLHKYHEEMVCEEHGDEESFATSWLLRGSRGNRVFVAGVVWSGSDSLYRVRYRVRRGAVIDAQREFPLDGLDKDA